LRLHGPGGAARRPRQGETLPAGAQSVKRGDNELAALGARGASGG